MTSANLIHESGHPKLVLWDNSEGWGGKRGGRRVQDGGTHVHPRLIHVDVWRKPPQYCKVTGFELKERKKERKERKRKKERERKKEKERERKSATLQLHVRASRCGGFSCCGAWALGYSGFRSCSLWPQWLLLSGSRAQAQWLWCVGLVALWHVGSGIEPLSPALAGRFFTTEWPRKPPCVTFDFLQT